MFHTPYGAFQRRAENISELNRDVGESKPSKLCRMKGQLGGDDYIERCERHDQLKTDAGWYEGDFQGDSTVRKKEKTERVVSRST